MIPKLKNFLFPRKENAERFSIHYTCSPYFAVKGISQSEIANIIHLQNASFEKPKKAFDFLWQEYFKKQDINHKQSRMIVSSNVQDWVFIYWDNGIFENCKKIIEKIVEKSNDSVNYYYADSNVDGYDWILADRGKIYRELQYSMFEISSNFGNPITDLEKKFIENIELQLLEKEYDFVFGENVYQSILEKTGSSILKYHVNNSKFMIGVVYI